jgi:flagellar biosynthesis activator protein FlaF
MQRNVTYFRTPQLGGATPRETEIMAFGLCNDRLSKADSPRARIEALHKTHQLWSLLVRDLRSPGNALPEGLKRQLVSLGTWAMLYATRAIPEQLSVQPLIDINSDMIDGLRAQAQASASTRAPIGPSRWAGGQISA